MLVHKNYLYDIKCVTRTLLIYNKNTKIFSTINSDGAYGNVAVVRIRFFLYSQMEGKRQQLLATMTDNCAKLESSSCTIAMNFTSQMDVPQSFKPPLFLTKTYNMVDDALTITIVSWSFASFVIWNHLEFP
jgi:hypothetical protein